jgi:hypothetical protein
MLGTKISASFLGSPGCRNQKGWLIRDPWSDEQCASKIKIKHFFRHPRHYTV